MKPLPMKWIRYALLFQGRSMIWLLKKERITVRLSPVIRMAAAPIVCWSEGGGSDRQVTGAEESTAMDLFRTEV